MSGIGWAPWMNEEQIEQEQSSDYHRAELDFTKFMDKARTGMTTDEDVGNA